MARAKRYLLPGQISHLTHRCHHRAFLLRFARDRDVYLSWLREGLRRFPVTLLGYCVTSNHVHLIVHGATAEAVSELMGLLEGQVGQQYNRRKGCDGAFWSDRFHATMIDTGEYSGIA
jgi:putative transposase